jgi:L-ascorbate metabolism protein UlaG (beta-lactamase superfamily)
VVYVDPYLSDSVERLEGPDLARLVPAPLAPDEVEDADWICITHAHLDHCDFDTLIPISRASRGCQFIGPPEVRDSIIGAGVDEKRVYLATEEWRQLSGDLRVTACPAAHTQIERDSSGLSRYVGYILNYKGRTIYHAGDTSLCEELLSFMEQYRPIDVAFLPVNECNYYRFKRGIIGNLSLREAFQFGVDLGANAVVPMHWDMFEPNRVYREEIELFYRLTAPPFQMLLEPTTV